MKFVIYNFLLLTALAMIPNSFSKTDCSDRSVVKDKLAEAEELAEEQKEKIEKLEKQLEEAEEE